MATNKWGKVLNTGLNQHNPAIDGKRVVWIQDTPSGHKVICVKNLTTNKWGKV